MATRVASAVLTTFVLAGCAATTPPPRFSAVSPADAAAPESDTPPLGLSLAAEAEASQGPKASEPAPKPAGGHEGHSMATPSIPEAGVYSCPMHPEVKQASPGSCPKCGMQLVKRKDERQQP